MRDTTKKWLLIVLCIVALALVAFSLISLATQQNTAGIIGGADGPTAIFVTGSPMGLYIATGVVLLITTVLYLIYRTRNTRE